MWFGTRKPDSGRGFQMSRDGDFPSYDAEVHFAENVESNEIPEGQPKRFEKIGGRNR
jgi:hypothetical protein